MTLLLQVLAYDHGNSSRNQTAIVTVSVEDVNDNKPVVPGAPYISTNLSEVQERAPFSCAYACAFGVPVHTWLILLLASYV